MGRKFKATSCGDAVPAAALYLRVSTGRQAESDLSIPDQSRQLRSYCEAKRWSVASEFVEPGNTATDDRRPAFQAMIDAALVRPPTFNLILVHSFSRFFRDQFQFEFYARKLARNGVRIISITQELGDDPMSLMMRQIMTLFDEYQSRENAKHTLRAMKENARQGFWNGARPPIGYKIVAAEQRGAKIKKRLEIDEESAPVVRRIYRLALLGEGSTGPLGVKAIAVYLNERGITTRDGGRWGVSSVHQTLTRTSYVGDHRFNTRHFASGEFKDDADHVVMPIPAIIDRETFDAVQRLMANRSPRTIHSRYVSGSTLLGGICFCGLCGGAMTLRTGKNGRYRYYTCCSYARTGPRGCGGLTLRMDKVDDAVIDYLETRFLSKDRLTDLMSNILDQRDLWIQRRHDHLGSLRKRATEAEAKITRLYAAIEDGLMELSDRQLKTRLSDLKTARDTAFKEAERVARAIERLGPTVTPALLEQFAKATREMLRNDDGTYRRHLVRAVAQRVEIRSRNELNISGCRIELIRTLATSNGSEAAALVVPGRAPEWRALLDSNQRPLA